MEPVLETKKQRKPRPKQPKLPPPPVLVRESSEMNEPKGDYIEVSIPVNNVPDKKYHDDRNLKDLHPTQENEVKVEPVKEVVNEPEVNAEVVGPANDNTLIKFGKFKDRRHDILKESHNRNYCVWLSKQNKDKYRVTINYCKEHVNLHPLNIVPVIT